MFVRHRRALCNSITIWYITNETDWAAAFTIEFYGLTQEHKSNSYCIAAVALVILNGRIMRNVITEWHWFVFDLLFIYFMFRWDNLCEYFIDYNH